VTIPRKGKTGRLILALSFCLGFAVVGFVTFNSVNEISLIEIRLRLGESGAQWVMPVVRDTHRKIRFTFLVENKTPFPQNLERPALGPNLTLWIKTSGMSQFLPVPTLGSYYEQPQIQLNPGEIVSTSFNKEFFGGGNEIYFTYSGMKSERLTVIQLESPMLRIFSRHKLFYPVVKVQNFFRNIHITARPR
jgi:hypothetical protein